MKGRGTISTDTAGFDAISDGEVDLSRDRQLVERCQGGDRSAFEELYIRYHRRLFQFCCRRLHEQHEAEDAVQEAFTRAWRALPSFAGERRFYPWLTVIAGNVCTDILRRRARLTPVDEVPYPHVDLDAHDASESMIQLDDEALALTALSHLSSRHQRVLQLREGSGWSTRQLAEHEGVGIPAMETLLWRARQALKREFAALSDAGSRLGAGLGVATLALRRVFTRGATKAGANLPLLSSARPGSLVPALALVGGTLVGTAALVTGTANAHVKNTPVVQKAPVFTASTPALPTTFSGRSLGGPSTGSGSSTPLSVVKAGGPVSPPPNVTHPGDDLTGGGNLPGSTITKLPGQSTAPQSLNLTTAGNELDGSPLSPALQSLGNATTLTLNNALSSLVNLGQGISQAIGSITQKVNYTITALGGPALAPVTQSLGGSLNTVTNSLSGGLPTTIDGIVNSLTQTLHSLGGSDDSDSPASTSSSQGLTVTPSTPTTTTPSSTNRLSSTSSDSTPSS
jgi:RNA polymerase sigma-70 factor (ECF subfamily)